jgi:hypothetical protein
MLALILGHSASEVPKWPSHRLARLRCPMQNEAKGDFARKFCSVSTANLGSQSKVDRSGVTRQRFQILINRHRQVEFEHVAFD